MSRAVRIDRNGGPEELKLVDVQVGDPGPGDIRIRHKNAGLNFIDVYQRSGLYPLPMPAFMGNEASGIVEAVGAEVKGLQVGDRVIGSFIPACGACWCAIRPPACLWMTQGCCRAWTARPI